MRKPRNAIDALELLKNKMENTPLIYLDLKFRKCPLCLFCGYRESGRGHSFDIPHTDPDCIQCARTFPELRAMSLTPLSTVWCLSVCLDSDFSTSYRLAIRQLNDSVWERLRSAILEAIEEGIERLNKEKQEDEKGGK